MGIVTHLGTHVEPVVANRAFSVLLQIAGKY
jgi:hypothetical protein